ncbi:MAG: hypothetical protein V8S12_00240 [Lachnospiraceae bacterium]
MLKLDLFESNYLLALAGYTFVPDQKTDCIICRCLQDGRYDPMEVDELSGVYGGGTFVQRKHIKVYKGVFMQLHGIIVEGREVLHDQFSLKEVWQAVEPFSAPYREMLSHLKKTEVELLIEVLLNFLERKGETCWQK